MRKQTAIAATTRILASKTTEGMFGGRAASFTLLRRDLTTILRLICYRETAVCLLANRQRFSGRYASILTMILKL
jgi:hypothetical protein